MSGGRKTLNRNNAQKELSVLKSKVSENKQEKSEIIDAPSTSFEIEVKELVDAPSENVQEVNSEIDFEYIQLEEVSEDFSEQSIPEEEPISVAVAPQEVTVQPLNKKKKKKSKVKLIVARVVLCFFTLLFMVVGGLFTGVAIINYGPSTHARDLFVVSMMETSAAKFLATWFFSPDEIKSIMKNNTVVPTDEVTNVNLVKVDDSSTTTTNSDKSLIEVEDVRGSTFKGKMMIIHDPSRVYVGALNEYGSGLKGKPLTDMVKDGNCTAGANAGGFEDGGGNGTGGIPIGIVISQGKLKYGVLTKEYEMCAFDKNNRFIVGRMTAQQALDKGVRDAVSFGPILIVNGNPCEVKGTGGGLNPRTALGQRADGAVLLLVIDGRQSNSPGASYQDLINVFTDYNAVNAFNLDGGSSSELIYQGQRISTLASLYGSRDLPTSILVK